MDVSQILPACESADRGPQSQTNRPLHILVAEDDDFLRQFNTEVLLSSGYEVDAAEDGADAWEALCADSHDLLITDENLSRKIS